MSTCWQLEGRCGMASDLPRSWSLTRRVEHASLIPGEDEWNQEVVWCEIKMNSGSVVGSN
jgi:hypothetical protein